MNTKVQNVFLVFAAFFSVISARMVLAAEVIEVPIDLVIAPERAFDDNDEVVLVVRGVLPSACYRVGATKVGKTEDPGVLVVHQFAVRVSDGPCSDGRSVAQLVDFTTEVKVGQLPAGRYSFIYHRPQGDKATRELQVREAASDQRDDFPYAATARAEVPIMISSQDEVIIRISGELRSTCTELEQDVPYERLDDVFVVRPVLEVKTDPLCAQVLRPFDRLINLGAQPPGMYLIHVRAMGGQSINRLIEVRR